MKKICCLLCTITLLLGLYSGCGTAGEGQAPAGAPQAGDASEAATQAGERIELQFWTHWVPSHNMSPWADKYIEAYNQSQDKYHVTHVAAPIDEYMNTKLPTAFATGAGPDVFFASPGNIGQFLDGQVCVPLDEYLGQEEIADFIPSSLEVSTRNGKLYGIPTFSDLCAFFYDADVLSEAGVKPPETWEELKQAAMAVNTPERPGITFEVNKGDWQTWSFMPFVWMQGDFFDEAGNSLLNTKAVVDALQLWRDLLDSGAANEKPSRSCSEINMIAEGETAMQINGSWAIPQLEEQYQDKNIVAAPLPIPDGGQISTVAGGWRVLVNKDTASVDGSIALLRYLFLDTPPTRGVEMCTVGNFAYPTRQSVVETASDFYRQGQRKMFTELLNPVAKPELAIPANASEILADMIQDALYNMAPQEAAEQAHQRMAAFIEGYDGVLG